MFPIFGRISKQATSDVSLSCEAKVLLGILCIYAGKNNLAFPSFGTLEQNLHIGKKKLRNLLVELSVQGYIKIGKQKSGQFRHNTYTIVDCPPKYAEDPENEKNKAIYEKIRSRGLMSAGYGIVPKDFLFNSGLHIKAQGILLYLCAYAGNTNTAYPYVQAILYHLQISENTYYKYMKQLTESGYVRIIPHKDRGLFCPNEYELIGHPNAKISASPSLKIDPLPSLKKPSPNSPSLKTDPLNTNRHTTNSNQKKNNINTNSNQSGLKIPKSKKNKKSRHTSLPLSDQYINYILSDLLLNKSINPAFLKDRQAVSVIVNQLSQNVSPQDEPLSFFDTFIADKFGISDNAPKNSELHLTVLNCISDMLFCNGKPNSQRFSPATFAELVHSHIIFSHDGVSFDNWLHDFENRYFSDIKKYKVMNIIAYTKTSIWNFLNSYSPDTVRSNKQSSFDIGEFFSKAADKSMRHSNFDDPEYADA